MALKACSECSREISTDSKACPHCGKRRPVGGLSLPLKIALGLIALFVLARGASVYSRPRAGMGSDVGRSPASASQSGVAVDLAPSQESLLSRFETACTLYKSRPNEIQKSAVFRASRTILEEGTHVRNWSGRLRRISTNQGGSKATLVISAGGSNFYDTEVTLGSPVYTAASNMTEGQVVFFSGEKLSDFNVLEQGKVCSPNFRIDLSGLKTTSLTNGSSTQTAVARPSVPQVLDNDRWVSYDRSAVMTAYYDSTSLSEHLGLVDVWLKIVFDKPIAPQRGETLSIILTHYELNCGEKFRFRELFTAFAAPDGVLSLPKDFPNASWEGAGSGTLGATVGSAFCAAVRAGRQGQG